MRILGRRSGSMIVAVGVVVGIKYALPAAAEKESAKARTAKAIAEEWRCVDKKAKNAHFVGIAPQDSQRFYTETGACTGGTSFDETWNFYAQKCGSDHRFAPGDDPGDRRQSRRWQIPAPRQLREGAPNNDLRLCGGESYGQRPALDDGSGRQALKVDYRRGAVRDERYASESRQPWRLSSSPVSGRQGTIPSRPRSPGFRGPGPVSRSRSMVKSVNPGSLPQ